MNLKLKKERREQLFAPQRLSNGRVRRFDAPQGLTLLEFVQQGLSLTPKKAFSIAEAMIVFTIVSVAIASVAPMISKQVKYNEMSDVQAKVLNQRIEEVKKSAWKLTADKRSITRPDDNVGIGVSDGTNPSAKLEVKNDDSSLASLKINVPTNFSNDLIQINQGNRTVFNVVGGGMTQARTGIEIFYPSVSGRDVNYLTTWTEDYGSTGSTSNFWRHILHRDGAILTRHSGDVHYYALSINDDEDKTLMKIGNKADLLIGNRKTGTNEDIYRFHINQFGSIYVIAPTREEAGGNELDRRNDARAFSIRYPQDFSTDKDCANEACSTNGNDGLTETAFFNSNGSLYINSVNMRQTNDWAGSAIQVRDGSRFSRAEINTDGQLILSPKTTSRENIALLVRTSIEEGAAWRAWIQRDGSAWFGGNVSVDGTIANAELDTKFAKVNEELVESRQIIVKLQNSVDSATQIVAELKSENAQLKEKLTMFEMQLAEVLAQNKLQNIASRQIVKK